MSAFLTSHTCGFCWNGTLGLFHFYPRKRRTSLRVSLHFGLDLAGWRWSSTSGSCRLCPGLSPSRSQQRCPSPAELLLRAPGSRDRWVREGALEGGLVCFEEAVASSWILLSTFFKHVLNASPLEQLSSQALPLGVTVFSLLGVFSPKAAAWATLHGHSRRARAGTISLSCGASSACSRPTSLPEGLCTVFHHFTSPVSVTPQTSVFVSFST